MIDAIGAAQQPRGAQRQLVGIGRDEPDRLDAIECRGAVGGQPRGDAAAAAERIERTAGGERGIDRAAPGVGCGPARPYRAARRAQLVRQAAERRREQRLEPLAQRLGEPGGGAAGADRDQHGITIDDRRQGEVAQFRPVGDIDEDPACLQPPGRGPGCVEILERDDREASVARLVDDARARALEQPELGGGRIALADQDDRAIGQAKKDRQAVHRALVAPIAPIAKPSIAFYSAAVRIFVRLGFSLLVAAAAPGHAQMGHAMAGMAGMDHETDAPAAPGAGSGTSRLPAGETMRGLHATAGDWTVMVHGYAWGVYTDQGGPRGADQAFVQSMAMVEAERALGAAGRLQLRAMLSLEPLMGDRGYPNLFATGETAGGRPLVDRQHPHDLFMELSGRIDRDIGPGSLFVYAGLPGEPALGPSAFMHRRSARFLPEAPITHHWFDSTHITFGVLTAGFATSAWQIEASAFNGREPDEARWDIETPRLDSWSVRGSWNPAPAWSAQLSYGRLRAAERLHPDEDEARLTASVAYTGDALAATVGWSRKDRLPGPTLDACFAEATWDVADRHALFGRGELVENDELFDEASPLHGRRFRVAKFTLGYAYSLPVGGNLSLALGAAASAYAKPAALDPAYGDAPKSVSLFAKLALGS